MKRSHIFNTIKNICDSSDDSDSDEESLMLLKLIQNQGNSFNKLLTVLGETLIKKRKVYIKNSEEDVAERYCEEEFRTHFRISRELFLSLCNKFQASNTFLSMHNDKRRITASKHVAIFLWFAGRQACGMRDVADRFDVSLSSVSRVIDRMSIFFSNMSPQVIEWPNADRMQESSMEFEKVCGFPKVIGCIGVANIEIDPQAGGKDDYIDRNGNVSVCLQAVCNEKKKFISVFVRYPGSCHNSWVFKNSPIYQNLDSLCEDYYLLGDSSYPNFVNLITPYKDKGHLTTVQKEFNMNLETARVKIEHTFEILKQRFRQLHYCKLRDLEKLCHFITACCVLHNIANEGDLEFQFDELPVKSHSDREIEA